MTRREHIWTYNIAQEQSGVIGSGFLDLYRDTKLDQSDRLVFELPADHNKVYLLGPDQHLRHRSRMYYIDEISEVRRGSRLAVEVQANALWYRLGDLDYPGTFTLDDVTPKAGLLSILNGTGWVPGPSVATTGSYSMEATNQSLLSMLRTWAKVTNTFIVWDTLSKTVDLVTERGATIGVAFRTGRNITATQRRRRAPAVTRLYPFGQDELTIAGANGGVPFLQDLSFYTDQGLTEDEAVELGYTKRKVITDTSFLKEDALLAAMEDRIDTDSQALTHVEFDVIDVSELTGIPESLEVGDTVTAQDDDLTGEFTTTVVGFRQYFLQPWRNHVELSSSTDIVADPSTTPSVPYGEQWVQFVGPVRSDFEIRNDGSYITNRIPLRFREGGRANFHLDLWVTGVGDGELQVSIIDAANGDEVQFHELSVDYTDGSEARVHGQWAREDLSGQYDFRVVCTTVADGGASSSKGVDIAADPNSEAAFWIMAQGAVQQSPVSANSERFDYVTDAPQTFTVPDSVTEITVELNGAGGGNSPAVGGGGGGAGAKVTFSVGVTPGSKFDIYAPKQGTLFGGGGWPGGGAGGSVSGNADGGDGGGYAAIIPQGGSLSSALGVAAGGGGGATAGPDSDNGAGGAGGFFSGNDGGDGDGQHAGGATQFAGGIASTVGTNLGNAGAFGAGGNGAGSGGSSKGGGGGGGGWYGGGGGRASTSGGGAGGGGSSYVVGSAWDIIPADGGGASGGNDGHVIVSWDDPTEI